MEMLQPGGWKRPSGYSNGIKTRGDLVFVAGQVGWDEEERMRDGLVAQVTQALENVRAVLAEGGARVEHVTRMTWYVVDMDAYKSSLREVGEAYRAVMGKHFPTMSLVGVAGLLEDGAVVEIEATAVIPEEAE